MSELIKKIFEYNGKKDYIGEEVTQLQHMAQAARCAELDGVSDQVIIGAFLHDIGHLIDDTLGIPLEDLGIDKIEYMITHGVNYGVKDHEIVGEKLCRYLGLLDTTCSIVRNHAKTKRYLVTSDPSYRANISSASLATLEHQGGLMTEKELEEYVKDPLSYIHIMMRKWDERAKDPVNLVDVADIDRYFEMIDKVIKENKRE